MQHHSEMLQPASPIPLHNHFPHHHHGHVSLEDSILASSPERHHHHHVPDHHNGETLNAALGASSSASSSQCNAGVLFDPESIPHLDLEMVDQPSITPSCPAGLDLRSRGGGVDLNVSEFTVVKSRMELLEDSMFGSRRHRLEGHNGLLAVESRLDAPTQQSFSDSEGDVIVECGVREIPAGFLGSFDSKAEPSFDHRVVTDSGFDHHGEASRSFVSETKHSEAQYQEAEALMSLDVSRESEGGYAQNIVVKPEYADSPPSKRSPIHPNHAQCVSNPQYSNYNYAYSHMHHRGHALPATVVSGPSSNYSTGSMVGVAPPPPSTLAAQVVGSAPLVASNQPRLSAIPIPSAEQGGFMDLPGDFDRMDLRYIGVYDDVVKKHLEDDVGKLIRVWSGERNRLYYDCMCKKRKPIKNLKAIASHARRHKQDTTSMEVYTCDKCGRVFAHYLGLNSHQRVHRIQTGDSPPAPSKHTEDASGLDANSQSPSEL